MKRKSIQVLLVFVKLKSGFQQMTYYRCLVSALNFDEKRQPVENRSDAFNRLAKDCLKHTRKDDEVAHKQNKRKKKKKKKKKKTDQNEEAITS